MFYGEYHHQLDDKGRLRIPTRFRELLGDNPVMMLSVEKFAVTSDETKEGDKPVFRRCIMIYTGSDFDRMVAKRFESADILNTKISELKRVIFPMAQPVKEDGHGRVSLAQTLLDKCGLSKNVISIGTMDHVEIWDEDLYYRHLDEIDSDAILQSFTE